MEEKDATRGLRVGFATQEDNEAILKLSHRCFQEGMITLYPDRSPQFNRIHRQLDPESYHVVALQGESVIGLLGILHQELYLGDRPFKTAYFLDFKVAPEYRLGLTAYRLTRKAIEREVSQGRRMGLATLLRGNKAVEVFTSGRVGFPASVYLGTNVVWNFIPLRKLKIDPQYPVSVPTEEDLPELVTLYNRYYSTYRLAPRMTLDLLKHYTTGIDGLGLDRFRVVRTNGKIRAVMAAWDEESYKRFIVLRRNFNIRMMNFFIRMLALLFRMPAPIGRNLPLRQQTMVLYAHDGCEDAIGALLRDQNNRLRGRGYSLFQMFIHEEDPIHRSFKGLTRVPVYSDIHLFTDTEELASEVREMEGLVHLEFPMHI